MKKLASLLVALLLFPAVYAERGADQPLEIVLYSESIQFQTEEQEETLYFPDFVDGGGWSVQLVLTNIGTTAGAAVVVNVYDQEGDSVTDLFDSATSFEIPSLGSQILKSDGTGQRIRRGWIEVRTATASVSGLLTYRHVVSGVEVGVESVELGDHFALFVEESSDIGTGLAIFKPESSPEIELRIRDEEGEDPLGGQVVRQGNFSQKALTIPEWFDQGGADTGFLRDFRGLLFLRSEDGSPFAPLGLRFGKQKGSLSAVPVIKIIDDAGCAAPNPFGGCGPGQPGPTVTMSASPSSIEQGQSATLRWSSTNAESASITPGIGTVPTSGSRSVSPSQTTTYRISVRSADGQTASATATVTVTDAQTPAAPTVSPVSDDNTKLEVKFEDSYEAGETKAYDLQVRRKTPRGSWSEACTTVTNDESSAGTATVSLSITGLSPETTYEVRYRHRNSSRCGSGSPGEWSEIGEGTTGDDTGKPPAPTVKPVTGDSSKLVVEFKDSFKAGETKAYDLQLRRKTPRGSWNDLCTTITNDNSEDIVEGTVSVSLSGRFSPGTVYEVRYRHRNSSRCGSGSPGEWSEIGEGRTGS